MAKAPVKKVSAPAKKSVAKPKAKTSSANIEKVTEDILAKLKSLGIEPAIQADLEWCIGSYRYDRNATGLVDAIGKALVVLKEAHAKKTKGVTATLLSNMESVLNG